MARAGPRKTARYGEQFKATAVKLSSLPGVLIQDVAAALVAFFLARRPASGESSLWNEIEILGKRQDDRHFEEARRLGLDDHGTVCVQEHPDLLLSGEGDWPEDRNIGTDHKPVWVLRQRWVLRKREVMAVERDTVRPLSCAENRRGGRVGGLLVAPG